MPGEIWLVYDIHLSTLSLFDTNMTFHFSYVTILIKCMCRNDSEGFIYADTSYIQRNNFVVSAVINVPSRPPSRKAWKRGYDELNVALVASCASYGTQVKLVNLDEASQGDPRSSHDRIKYTTGDQVHDMTKFVLSYTSLSCLPHIITFTEANELTNLIFNQTGVCITHRAVRLSTDH